MAVQITLEGQPPKYLTAPSYTLGRASDCDVMLPENDAMVSRHHARIERDADGQWWIVDSSTNGTFVNGEKLNGRRALHSGDQVGIGRTQIGFLSSQSAATPSAAPVRATETIFVTQDAVQAKIASVPMSPAAPVQAIAPSAPPEGIAVPLMPPVAPVASTPDVVSPPPSASLPAELVPAPLPVEVVPAPLPAPQKAEGEDASTHREQLLEAEPAQLQGAPEPSRAAFTEDGSVASPPVRIEPPSFEAPMPMPVASSPAIDDGQMKQCTRCRNVYSQSEEECPACGHAGFKVKNVAAQTAMAASLPASSAPPERTPFDVLGVKNSQAAPMPSYPAAPPVTAPPVPSQHQQPAVSHVVHHVALPQAKSPVIALILSLFFFGGGQFYNGQIGKGIGFFLSGYSLLIISLIPFIGWLCWLPLFGTAIWNIIDAYSTAERINARAAAESNLNLPR